MGNRRPCSFDRHSIGEGADAIVKKPVSEPVEAYVEGVELEHELEALWWNARTPVCPHRRFFCDPGSAPAKEASVCAGERETIRGGTESGSHEAQGVRVAQPLGE